MSDFGNLLDAKRDEVPQPVKPHNGQEYIFKIMNVKRDEADDKTTGEPYEFLNFGLKVVDGPGELDDMDYVWQRFRGDKPRLINMAWEMLEAAGVEPDGLSLFEAAEGTEGREFRATCKHSPDGEFINITKFRSV